jgi:hypothetical protein
MKAGSSDSPLSFVCQRFCIAELHNPPRCWRENPPLLFHLFDYNKSSQMYLRWNFVTGRGMDGISEQSIRVNPFKHEVRAACIALAKTHNTANPLVRQGPKGPPSTGEGAGLAGGELTCRTTATAGFDAYRQQACSQYRSCCSPCRRCAALKTGTRATSSTYLPHRETFA